MTDPSAPLDGIRVVDFTHVLAGPATAYFLGLLGADVIKVESVGRGDTTRSRGGTDPDRAAAFMSTSYLTQAGGKRAIALDLRHPDGYAVMRRLLEGADVLVENHRPRTLDELQLDYGSVSAINSRIIHCAMTGYGRRGPKQDAPAYDVNIQAASGLMSMTGHAGDGPTRTGAPIMDYATGIAGGFAVASALVQRGRTDQGTFIDVSMLETGLTLMSSSVVDYLATGNAPQQRGNAANSRSPAAGSFPTKDGLISLGINEQHQFEALAKVIGRPEWIADPRYADRQARTANTAPLEADLLGALAERTAAEWERLMLAAAVPAARVRTLPEALDDPQIAARNYLHEFSSTDTEADALVGGISALGLPFRVGAAANHTPSRPPARRGQHTVDILRELGFADDAIQDLLTRRVAEQAEVET